METETKSQLGPIGQAVKKELTQHPVGFKKHHRWPWAWRKWMALVDLVERIWPRNR